MSLWALTALSFSLMSFKESNCDGNQGFWRNFVSCRSIVVTSIIEKVKVDFSSLTKFILWANQILTWAQEYRVSGPLSISQTAMDINDPSELRNCIEGFVQNPNKPE